MKRVILAIGLLCFSIATAAATQFGPTQYAIKADDSDLIANFSIGADLFGASCRRQFER